VTDLGAYRPEGERRSIRLDRAYDAPVDRVWAALTEPEQVRGGPALGGAVLEPLVGCRFQARLGAYRKAAAAEA
jgi:hypothetical protein